MSSWPELCFCSTANNAPHPTLLEPRRCRDNTRILGRAAPVSFIILPSVVVTVIVARLAQAYWLKFRGSPPQFSVFDVTNCPMLTLFSHY